MGGIIYIPPAAAAVTIGNNLLRLPPGEVIDATMRPMEDGVGTDSGMQISTAFIAILARFFGVGTAAPGYLAEFSGNDNTGSTTLTTVTISNLNNGAGSFAGLKIKIGSGLNGGNIIGSKNTLLAYGHANGMTFKTGESGQDLGFTVSAASFAGAAAFVDWLMRNDGVMFLYNQNTPGSANYGKINIGNGLYDGAANSFAGLAAGTTIAVNERSGFTGNLIDLQIFGVSKFKVSLDGFITTTKILSVSPFIINVDGTVYAFYDTLLLQPTTIYFTSTGRGLNYNVTGAGADVAGTATLIGGTIIVICAIVDANSIILHSRKVTGGVPGFIDYVITPGVSITFNSTNALDTSTIVFEVIQTH